MLSGFTANHRYIVDEKLAVCQNFRNLRDDLVPDFILSFIIMYGMVKRFISGITGKKIQITGLWVITRNFVVGVSALQLPEVSTLKAKISITRGFFDKFLTKK